MENRASAGRIGSGADPVGPTRAARNSERKSALDQGCRRNFPAACHLVERSRGIRQKRLATAERQFVNPAEYEPVSCVVARITTPRVEIAFVLMSGTFLIRSDINRVTPRVVGQQ